MFFKNEILNLQSNIIANTTKYPPLKLTGLGEYSDLDTALSLANSDDINFLVSSSAGSIFKSLLPQGLFSLLSRLPSVKLDVIEENSHQLINNSYISWDLRT